MVTWAVGHLVQLAEPDAYDAKFKSWKMADLPIVPDALQARGARRALAQADVGRSPNSCGREDIDEVVNACDAGREGELIFAYLYEKAKGKKPVKRLWLNSMTNAAMKSALQALRPAEEFEPLEEAARSRSEADWIVGMNATRAATIRLRFELRRRRLAGPRPDPDAGDRGAPRGGDQGLQARALLARGRHLRGRPTATARERRRRARLPGQYHAPPGSKSRARAADHERGVADAIVARLSRAGRGRSPSWRRKSSARKRRCSTT